MWDDVLGMPVLLDAMRACGSLFVPTQEADAYRSRTMREVREEVSKEFVSLLVFSE